MADVFGGQCWREASAVSDAKLRTLCLELKDLAFRSKERSTSNKYSAAFTRWARWTTNFPEVKVIPANPLHVAAYFNHLAKTSGFSAVESAYYAISWYHKLSDFPDPTLHNLPTQVKEGIKRKLGKPPVRKAHATLGLVKDIICMASASNQLIDLRLATMSALSFSGFLRFNDISNIRVGDISLTPEKLELLLRKSKTDVYSQGQSIVIARSGKTTCPVALLEDYLRRANPSELHGPQSFIFRAIQGSGSKSKLKRQNKPISYSRAREIFLKAVKDLGYDAKLYGLHSLRSGGTTAAAASGVDHALLKKHGRWKSDSAKDLYVRFSQDKLNSVSKSTGL